MCGWRSRASARPSRRNRATLSLASAPRSGSSLSARISPSPRCRTLYTDACPPPPRRPSTSYFPAMTVGVGIGIASARRLGTGDADLPEELEEVVQLRMDERLAAREQGRRDRALGVRPADDVGEPDVSE